MFFVDTEREYCMDIVLWFKGCSDLLANHNELMSCAYIGLSFGLCIGILKNHSFPIAWSCYEQGLMFIYIIEHLVKPIITGL